MEIENVAISSVGSETIASKKKKSKKRNKKAGQNVNGGEGGGGEECQENPDPKLADLSDALHEKLHIKFNGTMTNGELPGSIGNEGVHNNVNNILSSHQTTTNDHPTCVNGCEKLPASAVVASESTACPPKCKTPPPPKLTELEPLPPPPQTSTTESLEQQEQVPPPTASSSSSTSTSAIEIEYKEYESELQMPDIIRLIQGDLSEPYSIYTYRYFIHNWPKLCLLAMHGTKCVGAIVCKLDMHRNVKRGYIAMLAVDKDYRKLKIGTNLVQKAIQAMLNDSADEVVLETEITNIPALRLYENLGFVRDKRLFHYYLNGFDALRLKLWFR